MTTTMMTEAPLAEFGCFVRKGETGDLETAPMNADGTCDAESWGIIERGMLDAEFAHAVNGVLGTNFKPDTDPEDDVTPLADVDFVAKLVANLTDENLHGDAVIVLAKFSGDKTIVAEAERIQHAHLAAGHLTDELSAERSTCRRAAVAAIVVRHGKDVQQKITKGA